MPQSAIIGRIPEPDLGDQLRLDPVRRSRRRAARAARERTVRPLDPIQSRPQVPEDRVAEARADLAAVHQPTVFPRADMERTKACPRARRVREAADHELARTVALHLHPVPAPAAPVGSRRPLRDDPLETVLARTPEELRTLT